jgi:hypothetical protein
MTREIELKASRHQERERERERRALPRAYPSRERGFEIASGHEFGDDVLARLVIADTDQLYNVRMVQIPEDTRAQHAEQATCVR